MRIYGNLMNRIAEDARQDPVQPGDGATLTAYSDRYAATVVEATDTAIVVQEDTATRTDRNGQSEAQTYAYERNTNGKLYTFTLRKNGRWVEKGQRIGNGLGLVTGIRQSYRDPGF